MDEQGQAKYANRVYFETDSRQRNKKVRVTESLESNGTETKRQKHKVNYNFF